MKRVFFEIAGGIILSFLVTVQVFGQSRDECSYAHYWKNRNTNPCAERCDVKKGDAVCRQTPDCDKGFECVTPHQNKSRCNGGDRSSRKTEFNTCGTNDIGCGNELWQADGNICSHKKTIGGATCCCNRCSNSILFKEPVRKYGCSWDLSHGRDHGCHEAEISCWGVKKLRGWGRRADQSNGEKDHKMSGQFLIRENENLINALYEAHTIPQFYANQLHERNVPGSCRGEQNLVDLHDELMVLNDKSFSTLKR